MEHMQNYGTINLVGLSRNNMIKVHTKNMKNHATIVWRMLRLSAILRPGVCAIYTIGALLEIISSLLTIYASAQIASILASFISNGDAGNIWFWLWIDIAAAAGIIIGFAIMNYAQRLIYFSFAEWSTIQFQATLCRIDIPDFYNEKIRNKINKVSNGYTWQIANLASANFELIYGIVRFIAITLVVSQISWWLVPLIILFLIPSLIAEGRISKILWFVWDEKGDERHTFWGLEWIIRQPKGQMELRSTQARSYVLNKIKQMLRVFYSRQENKYNQASKFTFPAKILEVFGTAIGAITLLRQVLAGTISLERYFFLSGALLRIGGALSSIFGTLARMQDMLVFASSYFELIDQKASYTKTNNHVDISKNTSLDIEFQNVSFTYPGSKKAVFHKFNLTINSGEHIAIVGENGAGKSTLIKLLMRYYRPDSGKILVNGIDLETISIESWYSHIATLFQDFNQYPLPIDENIAIGKSDVSVDKEKLEYAAHAAGIDNIIKKYPYGWKTVLDASFKNGVEPSGGQWQRIGLARAFYRSSNIIILDEPTSAIDANGEYQIFNSIFDEFKNKTAVIISHRFSTVRRANRIIVVDKGEIIEQGTHQELIKKNGLYQIMFSKQAEGYK
jgi:ATP-binding cassette, subfamily B, bacterial